MLDSGGACFNAASCQSNRSNYDYERFQTFTLGDGRDELLVDFDNPLATFLVRITNSQGVTLIEPNRIELLATECSKATQVLRLHGNVSQHSIRAQLCVGGVLRRPYNAPLLIHNAIFCIRAAKVNSQEILRHFALFYP
mgnify:CR=1 FL=1